MKTKITLLLLISCFNTFSQKWTEMMTDTNANFYDIVKEFDTYWKDRLYEKGKGYKAFKRWQWFAEPRVFPSGNLKFASRGYALEKYQEFLNENPKLEETSNNLSSASSVANWTPLGPFGSPAGGGAGRIQVICANPTNTNSFYVGSAAGGFWITNNGGMSYTTTTDQLGSCGVSDIAINSINTNIIYISTGDRDAGDTYATGVLKSIDGGLTWSNTGLVWQTIQQRRIYRLLINPINPNTLIAATSVGIYRSLNAGQNWSLISSGNYVDAEYRPNDTTTVYAVTSNGLSKSINGGASFAGVSAFPSGISANRLSIAVSRANANYLYVLASNNSNGFGGLYRSLNSGTTFSLMSSSPNIFDWSTTGNGTGGQGWYDIAIDASPSNADEIIAGGVNSWKSTNGGANWVLNSHWYGGGGKPYVHADLHYVLYTSGTTCFLGTDGGVSKTSNNGQNWTEINGNMNIAQMYKIGLASNNSSKLITGHQDNGSNLLNGSNWSQVYGGDGMDCFIDWNNNNTLVASTQNGGFTRSINGGANWSAIVSGLSGNPAWVAPIVQDPLSANTYYCGYQNVFKSTNQGNTWTIISNFNTTLDEIKVSPLNPNIIFATSTNAIWKTSNGGTTWSNITPTNLIGNNQITDLTMDNLNPNNIYITLSGYSAGIKVLASYNGGSTWINYSQGLPNIPTNCIVYVKNSPQGLYIGTDVGVYYREANMSNWISYFTGLPNIIVQDLEIYYSTGKLRAATYARGVWETNLYSNPTSPPTAAFNTQFSPGCINTSLQFNDVSANSPNSWNWTFSGGSPSTSTVQSPSVTFPATGIYTVSLISSNGFGPSAIYTNTISIVNTPTLAAISGSVCDNQIGTIGVNSNANNINWSSGQQGFFIPVSNSVTSIYNFTASLGACNSIGSSTLYVSQTPITPSIISTAGYLTALGTASSYQWYYSGSLIPGATTQTYIPIQNGWYSVWAGNDICFSESDYYEFYIDAIQQISTLKNKISIRPNPVRDELNLKFENEIKNETDYEIHNSLGQLIIKSKFKIENKETKIITQTLPSGFYFLSFLIDNKTNYLQFIKN
ncbi:MAG: T9SS C-terminal target domain-containing protein [Sphingobacteriia bacterium]|nr:T9SS C-terminal target domain-containing protein [Candidatus Fonsibacter lacus]